MKSMFFKYLPSVEDFSNESTYTRRIQTWNENAVVQEDSNLNSSFKLISVGTE